MKGGSYMRKRIKKPYVFYILSLCFGILVMLLVGLFVKSQEKMMMEVIEEPSYGKGSYWKFKTNKKLKLIRYTVYQLENGKWEKIGEEQKELGKMKSGILRVIFDPFQQDNVDVAILQSLNSDKKIEVPSIFTESKYKDKDKFFKLGNAICKTQIEYGKEIPLSIKILANGKKTDISEQKKNDTMEIEGAKIYFPDISFEHPEYYNDKQYKEAFLMTICFE